MFLYLEYPVGLLEHHAYSHIESFGFFGGLRVIGVLHVAAFPLLVGFDIDHICHEFGVQVAEAVQAALHVDHRTNVAVLVGKMQRRNAVLLAHLQVVSAKGAGNVYNTGTVLCGDVVAGNHAECTLAGIHPGYELLVVHACQVGSGQFGHYLPGEQFVALLIVLKRQVLGLWIEHRVEQSLGHSHGYRVARVGVIGAHHAVVNLRAYAQGSITGQSPGGGCPCQQTGLAPAFEGINGVDEFELCYTGGILYITVAAGLIQLMRAQTGTRRIWLYGIAFVQIVFLVQLGKQPPHRFDIAVIKCYVRIVEIHPIAHRVSQGGPLPGIFEHFAATCGIIFVDRYFFADVFLGDAKSLLHAQLHRQAVSIPAGLTLHMEALHGLVATNNIFDSTRHNMMDARHTVGRRGTFVKHKTGCTFTHLHALLEEAVVLPLLEHPAIYFRQVKYIIFSELHLRMRMKCGYVKTKRGASAVG